ncbi:MHYT domain-containing protein [Nocardia australiensis]|uniref:MHYT domain-containing protein n=1 Tax=Nocardia australiensis TaxID=2887191 RepID=UPI0027E0F83C|nr:MHYT domain-containing protein [Nocardia australiensis]
MLELDHFSYGWVTPFLSYVMSVIGSMLGLRCVTHARSSEWPAGWLIAAAVSLGGAGIWVMHFTAMLGFSIPGVSIRYNVPMTLLSAAIAMAVVWIGLSIVVRWQRELVALPIGGAVTGLGVAAMHYLGMFAMETGASVEYSSGYVALSLVIAVVAATAALWFMLHVRGLFATIGAALIMGLAVCGMHYTGMASMHAHHANHQMTPDGAQPVQLLSPLIVVVTLVTMGLIILVGLAEIGDRGTRERLPKPEAPLTTSTWPTTDQVRQRESSGDRQDWALGNTSATLPPTPGRSSALTASTGRPWPSALRDRSSAVPQPSQDPS